MAAGQALHRFKPFRHDAAIAILVLLAVAVGQCDALAQAPRQGNLKHYSVRLHSSLPLAAYSRGFSIYPGWTDDDQTGSASVPASLMATPTTLAAEARTMIGRGIPRRARLTMENPQIRTHANLLEYQQNQVAASVGLSADQITYSFKYALHGFAALLTPLQAWQLRRHSAVASVRESYEVRHLTTDSPTFLNMGGDGSLWPNNGGQSSAGDGMVVAIVDTGIWPEHPSFSDSGFSSTKPAGWTGKCDTTADFKCNNKIIGARAIYAGAKKDKGSDPDLTADWLSPRDAGSHGTWCAGAAAGNKDVAMAGGKASGMAPAARLAIYKVFWTYNGSNTANSDDILAAVDQAVADGVDVISLSLGGIYEGASYFDEIPLLNANLAGVFVTYAAGNSGPPNGTDVNSYRTLSNFSPFYLTVGASSIERNGAVLPKAINDSSSASMLSAYPLGDAAPRIGSFSSTGPVCPPWTNAVNAGPTNSILKPDIVGPGVKLYAAAPGKTVGETGSYSQKSGTSMATPHLAGIAALILQKYPKWSPAQVMSAIMTTAVTSNTDDKNIKNDNGDSATPWEMGQGHVYPPKVLDPGLTYDARAAYYMNFLAGQSLSKAQAEFPDAKLVKMPPRNLNRASIAVARLKGNLTVTRRVTNVADSKSTYKVKIKSPKGVSVKVSPKKFTIGAGKKVWYTVTLKVTKTSEEFKYGSLTWKDGDGHSVRTVLAVQPVAM